jgi:hypothetical protein
MSSESVQPQVSTKTGPAAARSFGRAANWTVGVAAAALVLTSVGGYFYHRGQLSAIAADHLRLIVTGPSNMQTGIAAEFTVSTTSINNDPLPAQIEVALLGPDDASLKAYSEPADEHGRLKVVIPADLSLPRRVTMRVVATYHDSREQAELSLGVEPIRYATRLALDRPAYQPGETVFYRSLTLSQSTLTSGRNMPVHFEVLDSEGSLVPTSSRDATTMSGVASGDFAVPKDLATGWYTLVARSPNDAFPPCEQTFAVHHASVASNKKDSAVPTVAPRRAEADSKKIDVQFFPEGGGLAAGVENRVFVAARNSLGHPIALSGVIVGKTRGENAHEQEVASVETTSRGLGAFRFTPQADTAYRLKIAKPKQAKDEPRLPAVSVERDIVLNAGTGIFAPAKPLEFTIRAARAGIPLVVAAYCRGVQVGQQPLITRANANTMAIALDSAIGGAIRLAVYDYTISPPRLAAERLVYRRPTQMLSVRVSGMKPRYAPGENVDLSLQAVNEKDESVPAAFAMAVAEAADGGPMPTMTASFLLGGQMASPSSLEPMDVCLSDNPKDVGALELLLGTSMPADQRNQPPTMFDNLRQIRANYQENLADYRADRTESLNTLTTASFFGGLGLVMLVAMLGLMRIVSGMHLWVAAIGATTCCLIIGAILMDPGRSTVGQEAVVAFSSCCHGADASGLRSETGNRRAPRNIDNLTWTGKRETKQEPHSPVFWSPLLIAGPDGKVAVHFKLPDVAGTFRVTIDAHGDGRLGAARAEIISSK